MVSGVYLYVGDRKQRVVVFEKESGEYVKTVRGKEGTGRGELEWRVYGLWMEEMEKLLYVVDTDNNRIQVWK